MKTQEQILKELYEFAESLGMHVFFNTESQGDTMDGFIIGTEDFFMSLSEGHEDLDEYNKVIGIETIGSKEDLH